MEGMLRLDRSKEWGSGAPASRQAKGAGQDFYVERDGMRFAGTHLIVDLWGGKRLDEIEHVEDTLREAVEKASATLLRIDLHQFEPNGGVSGVAVLSESHISIHTWPERSFAAVDVFMCGSARPYRAVDVLRDRLAPSRITVVEHRRGILT